MKKLTFCGYADFGAGDTVDMDIDVELTDEEYARGYLPSRAIKQAPSQEGACGVIADIFSSSTRSRHLPHRTTKRWSRSRCNSRSSGRLRPASMW